MKLSIVIVSYNVCYFLEQALSSVFQSITNFDYEVFVVDNGSKDDSVAMVKSKYPQVDIVETGKNLGFAKANNIAAASCKGEYLLLLNPDTILKNDTLQKCVDYLEQQKNAGALGVKMYDGGGQFLPESKRGFPGPWTALCKITGLNNLFPGSKLFNYYYLGHLSDDKNQPIDVLTGAFMMMKRHKYIDLNGLDEEFFMYGEDIDLCYRLSEQGYQNHYLATSSIIHFKGESTSKQTVKYITTFYNAMSIYAKKHYNKRIYALLSLFIQLAIYARAGLAIFLQRFKGWVPLFRDYLLLTVITLVFCWFAGITIPKVGVLFWSALFPLGWYLANAYSENFKWWNYLAPALLICLLILLINVVYPVNVLIWTSLAGLVLPLLKIIFRLVQGKAVFLPDRSVDRLAGIVSDSSGEQAVMKLLDLLPKAPRRHKLCDQADIENWVKDHSSVPNEIIFDPKSISWNQIVNTIVGLSPDQDFRILAYDKRALITSLSKNRTAMIITSETAYHTFLQYQMQNKRMSDRLFSVFVIFCFPYFIFTKNFKMVQSAFQVLFRGGTWVGLSSTACIYNIRRENAVYTYGEQYGNDEQLKRAQVLYASNYHPLMDWEFLLSRI